jgi:hypothetical protein
MTLCRACAGELAALLAPLPGDAPPVVRIVFGARAPLLNRMSVGRCPSGPNEGESSAAGTPEVASSDTWRSRAEEGSFRGDAPLIPAATAFLPSVPSSASADSGLRESWLALSSRGGPAGERGGVEIGVRDIETERREGTSRPSLQ